MPDRDYYLKDDYSTAREAYKQFMIDFMTAVANNSADEGVITSTADKVAFLSWVLNANWLWNHSCPSNKSNVWIGS